MHKTLLVLPKPSRFDIANNGVLMGPARELVDATLGDDTYDIIYAPEFNLEYDTSSQRPSVIQQSGNAGSPKPMGRVGRTSQTTITESPSRNAASSYDYIILTGQESLDRFIPGKTLTSARGFIYHLGASKLVATFWPQDCVDLKDYESALDEEDDQAAGSTGKDDAPTQRANYRFWFQRDLAKLRSPAPRMLVHDYHLCTNGEAARILGAAVAQTIYLDIETHPDTDTLQCFSFAVGDGPVITCSIYDYRGQLVPGSLQLIAALCRSLATNKVVIHNCGFDLLFLALFHGIPFGQDIEDTMLIHHRIWPEAEKSLAHCISLYTNEPYHKSEGGTWNPRNAVQQDRLLRYNSKDVATLRAVHRAQWDYIRATGDQGLHNSVVQVNRSIYPYLYTSLHGTPVNGALVVAYKRARQFAADQYARIVTTLAGYPMNPGSPQQLVEYFVTGLAYPVLAKTPAGLPSVDEATLYKYLSKYKNPIIRAILKYKRARKVAGELGFAYWISPKGRL